MRKASTLHHPVVPSQKVKFRAAGPGCGRPRKFHLSVLPPGAGHQLLEARTPEGLDEGAATRFQDPAGHVERQPSACARFTNGSVKCSRNQPALLIDRRAMLLLPYNRPMDLTERQRKHLRGLAHPLNPVILVGGDGLTEGVIAETARALHDHELIKVKVRGAERADRDAMLERLAAATQSALVTRIGHVAVLYRPRPGNPKVVIPDAPGPAGQT